VPDLKAENDALKALIAEMRDVRPSHQHMDPKTGFAWACRSPYCQAPYDCEVGAPEVLDERGVHGRRT
jgi:hypothetical protein